MKIVLLCGKGDSSLYMYNGISIGNSIEAVIQEDKISSKKILKRRIKKLGIIKVINQVLFQVTIPRMLTFFSKKRIKYLKEYYALKDSPISQQVNFVSSVNSDECLSLIKSINPDIVIVNGTRIISKKILSATKAVFINTHVGITPQYRGIHGAYWALINKDYNNCGVTIHKVDKGIDTGQIISQEIIEIQENDNFVTYPVYQYGIAIQMMEKVLTTASKGNIPSYKKEEYSFSKLWYHPTFTSYLYNRIFKGVK